jgi:D-alanyl-D-alanine carboxypeptidase
MKQDGRQHDDTEVQGGQGQALRPAPGKVTLAGKLAPGRAPVQRQASMGRGAGPARAARDPEADAWMDAAHRGAVAAPADGTAVQRQAATAAGTTGTAATSKVKLTIEWRGQFGADLSARLRVQGRNDKRDKWVTLEEDVEVTDADGIQGAASDKLSHSVEVDRYGEYSVTFSPVAEKPDDRYRDTSASVRVGASDAAATLSTRLDVNRWNRKNVDDVWKGKNIDPDKADDVVSASLFGRTVNVNKAVVARVAQTNALYEGLKDEAVKQGIRESLFVTGGYAVRTTRDGTYSNHSVGYAVDVNYNESTKQNHHFEKKEMSLLTELVQPVVRTDPGFTKFDIKRDSGLQQLQASQVFNERFPAYLANLLDMGADAKELDQYLYVEKNVGYYADYFRNLREQKARQLFDGIDSKTLSKAIQAQKDATKKARLQLIQSNWGALRAWLFGVTVRDEQEKKDKRIVGMIPLREDVLKMFLDTGWDWGGDWREEKDYMHFEDRQALAQVQLQSGTKP